MLLLALWFGILSNGWDASKPNSFGLLSANCVQGISRQASSASLHHQGSNPNPLPGQFSWLALLHIHQHLDIWGLVQFVLNSFQVGYLVNTMHGDICIQAG